MKIRNTIIEIIVICLILLSFPVALICWKYPKYDKDKEYVREYIIGDTGIKGSVDVTKFGTDSAYEIGADKDGYAVFKNPNKAFAQMKIDCAKGIEAIRKEYIFLPLSRWNMERYKDYGWQLTKTKDEEAIAQAGKVSGIMDIYENSFKDSSIY